MKIYDKEMYNKEQNMKSLILNCAKQFDEDVKSGKFPNEEEIF